MDEKQQQAAKKEEPDYSKATSDDILGVLMALHKGQPEDALQKALDKIPSKQVSTEDQ